MRQAPLPSVSESHDLSGPAPRGPGSLGRALARVAPATMGAMLVGFASSVVVARRLGATTMTDAYYLAYSVATLRDSSFFLRRMRQGAIPLLTEATAESSGQVFSRGCSELLTATWSSRQPSAWP